MIVNGSIDYINKNIKEKSEFYCFVNQVYEKIQQKYPDAHEMRQSNIDLFQTIIPSYCPAFQAFHNEIYKYDLRFFISQQTSYNKIKIISFPNYSSDREALICVFVDLIDCTDIKPNTFIPVFSEPIILATACKPYKTSGVFSYHVHRINNHFHPSDAAKQQTIDFCKAKTIEWIDKNPFSNNQSNLISLPSEVIEQVKNSKILK